jgi:hypothetical protein
MARQPFVGPWLLTQFHDFFTQSIGLLGKGNQPAARLIRAHRRAKTKNERINVYTNIHALSGIRTHDPSV